MPPTDAQPADPANATEELVIRLQQQLSKRFRGVRVRLRHDALVLEGRVPSYYAKQVAQHLVMGLTQLPIAANDIVVG